MSDTTSESATPAAPESSRNRATVVLFGLAAALMLVYGALYLFSGPRVGIGEVGSSQPKGDVRLISFEGESVDVTKHLADGKLTVIDFYADWCQPCREITPYLESLARANDTVAIRKVNVEHWGTPVVAQYKVTFLPYLQMYGPQGDKVADGADEVLAELRRRF